MNKMFIFTDEELVTLEFCLQSRCKVLKHRIRTAGGIGCEDDMKELKGLATKLGISWEAVTS